MQRKRVADIALDPRTGGSEAVYTYAAEAVVQQGDAVFVPLGTRSALGFVVSVYDATEEDLGFPFESLKTVSAIVDGLSVPDQTIDLAKFVTEEYLCSLPVALSAATPPGVRERLVQCWTLDESAPVEVDLFNDKRSKAEFTHELTPLQKEVIRVMRESDGVLIESKTKKIPSTFQKALRLLRGKGLVRQSLRINPPQEKRKGEPMLRLCADETKVEDFLHKEGKRKPAQALTVMKLQSADCSYVTAAEIRAMAGVTDSTIKALVEAGLIDRVDLDSIVVARAPTPNDAQTIAIDAIAEAVRESRYQQFLLYGVTGSGKTEVYLRAASEALKQGRQVLYVVPEIALAAQAIGQLRERFGRTVAILHSDLPPTERLLNWLRIRNGQASIVLGARSALFAPLTNLGLVILDEEHEGAYKQESAPRYHAKQVAKFLGQRHGCPVVLGSATPSIESFYEAESAENSPSSASPVLLSMPQRAAKATLPTVMVRDLTEGYKSGRPGILSPDLHDRVWMTLDKGEQVILFLNRRAYAPFIICRDCGHQFYCPNCSVSLSFHRRDRRLRCHHCGFNTKPPDTCPNCNGTRLNPFGVGTEKVEEAVAAEFPDARVARLDRDVARRKGALEEILALFRSGEIQILVGTQMVAKGLDFPNVTLVGVIAADVSLNIPDFRSSERTFQLLSQVAGRAGRGQAPGQVMIQTFNPNHMAVKTARDHDFLTFYEVLKKERMEAGYPPFRRLVNIVFSGELRGDVQAASDDAKALLDEFKGEQEILGPVDCVVERLQTKWRRHMLVKMAPGASAAWIGEALLGFAPKGVQVVIDVDAYSLM